MKEYIKLNSQIMQKKDGFYQLEKDKEAVVEFEKERQVKTKKFDNTQQRVKWLIENDYYVDFLLMYPMSFIEELTEKAFKTHDKKQYLETYEDRIISCALYLGQGNKKLAWDLALSMIHQEYQPATPTFQNAGKKRGGEMTSCFLLSCDDS